MQQLSAWCSVQMQTDRLFKQHGRPHRIIAEASPEAHMNDRLWSCQYWGLTLLVGAAASECGEARERVCEGEKAQEHSSWALTAPSRGEECL